MTDYVPLGDYEALASDFARVCKERDRLRAELEARRACKGCARPQTLKKVDKMVARTEKLHHELLKVRESLGRERM